MQVMKFCFQEDRAAPMGCSVQGSLVTWDLRAKASFPQPLCFFFGGGEGVWPAVYRATGHAEHLAMAQTLYTMALQGQWLA